MFKQKTDLVLYDVQETLAKPAKRRKKADQ